MEALSLSGCFEVKLLPAVIILENYGVSRPVKEKDFFTEGVGWVWLVVHMVEKKSWQAKAWLILEPSCYSTLIFTTSSARLSLFSRKCPLKRFLFFKKREKSFFFFFVSFFDEIVGITVASTRVVLEIWGNLKGFIKKADSRNGKRGWRNYLRHLTRDWFSLSANFTVYANSYEL